MIHKMLYSLLGSIIAQVSAVLIEKENREQYAQFSKDS